MKSLNPKKIPLVPAWNVGQRLKLLNLAKGWPQQVFTERPDLAISTLKLLEAEGNRSSQRLIQVAVDLGWTGSCEACLANPERYCRSKR